MLVAISAPVLVLVGSDTKPFATAYARHVADHILHAPIHDIPGAGHAAPLTYLETLSEALAQLFSPGQHDHRRLPPGGHEPTCLGPV